MAFKAYDSSVRVVCQNTLNASLASIGDINLRVSHTKNCEVRISNMTQALADLFVKRDAFYATYEGMTSKGMTLAQAERILVGFLTNDDKASTRAKNVTQNVLDLFVKGKGNSGQTRADLLNGLTEYYTHEASDNTRKLFSSSEFGSGAMKKAEFFSLLADDVATQRIEDKGKALLVA
jgi:hypothetical protein